MLKQKIISVLNKHPKLKYKIKKILSKNNEHGSHSTILNDTLPSGGLYAQETKKEMCAIKKSGVHEKQKSVLESWFY